MRGFFPDAGMKNIQQRDGGAAVYDNTSLEVRKLGINCLSKRGVFKLASRVFCRLKAEAMTEQDIRFYDKGTAAESDEVFDDHVRWQNARYFNEDSNVVRSSVLIVQLRVGESAEYINFHVGELYRLYWKSGMKGVLPTVKNDITGLRATAGQQLAFLNQLGNYEAIKECLIIRPLNYDNNEKVLSKAIHRRIGDMALVLYVSLGHTMQGGSQNIISTMVRQDMFQLWNVEEQEAFDWALENTMRLQPPVFYHIIGGLEGKVAPKRVRFMEDESVSVDFNSPFAPVLTTEQEVNGAIAAFCPGVLERLYRMVGEDFYLVFSGISDVHIHPVSGPVKVSSMRRTLADMNQNANKRDEILSRHIYRYDGEKKKIARV